MTPKTILNPKLVEIPVTPAPHKTNIFPLVIVVLLSLTFVASIYAAYYYGFNQNRPTPSPTITPIPTNIPTITPAPNSDEFGALTWNISPKKVTNPDIIAPSDAEYPPYGFADTGTYEVAKFSGGASLLITFIYPEGPSSPIPFRIISDKKQYYVIESFIKDDYIKKDLDNIFDKSKVKVIAYQIKDLYNDTYLQVGSNSYLVNKNSYYLPQFITSIKNSQLISKVPTGEILVVDTPVTDQSSLSNRNIFLKLHDFTLVPYLLNSAIPTSDNQVPYFTLLDNTQNKAQYSPLRSGCGSGQNTTIITNPSLLDSKTLIGKSGNTEIYQLKATSNSIVKYLYDQYKIGRDDPSSTSYLTLDQFATTPNHIIYQEKDGAWMLLVNTEYAVQAECGKPVVYLYPQKDTEVTVKVGANITKSEPIYSENGWTVLAHPNGQLDYQGKVYPNLFWEGIGHGIYNSHSGEGFVVSQNNLISTLKSQLTQLGLNSQEIADFLEFWAPKLPTTPYIRLTWLTTADMNHLAPLSVSPVPDTTIRIFLDFAGLTKPIKLISQTLTSTPRTGFTLVEWGGLLVK